MTLTRNPNTSSRTNPSANACLQRSPVPPTVYADARAAAGPRVAHQLRVVRSGGGRRTGHPVRSLLSVRVRLTERPPVCFFTFFVDIRWFWFCVVVMFLIGLRRNCRIRSFFPPFFRVQSL